MPASPSFSPGGERQASLDVYRGFVLLAFLSAGLGMARLHGAPGWGWLADQLQASGGEGCTFWDLIQPFFLFIAGIALPFSQARREGMGHSYARQFAHGLGRSGVLILLGWFLDAYAAGRFELSHVGFTRCLQQIAVAYFFAFLLVPLGVKVQATAIVFLLAGHTAAYVIYGNIIEAPAWDATRNFGAFLDARLGLPAGPHQEATFNAVSGAAVVLLGVLCGALLRGPVAPGRKVAFLFGAGLVLLGAGWALSGGGGWLPVSFRTAVPMIPRLATSSFSLFAAGWGFALMGLFYLLIDVMMVRFWTLPFIVLGMNSIFLYVASELLRPVAHRSVAIFLDHADAGYRPVLVSVADLGLFWLMAYGLYVKKAFVKV